METVVPGLKALKCIKTDKSGGGHNGKGDLGEPLSPMARLFHEPGSNVYIIAILASKTKIYPDIVKANLVHTLLKHPRFTSLQVTTDKENGGEMRWVPTNVDLDEHVIVPTLDPDMDSPDKFVEDYISNLSKTTIDISKPLWDLHLLNLKTSDAEGTGVFRIHHSIGDGMSLVSLLLACTRKTSDPEALPTVPTMQRSSLPLPKGFWEVVKVVWNSLVGLMMFVMTAMFLKDTKTPLKGPPGVENNPRRFVHRTVSLEDAKLVKNAMNVTINDVVLGVTQAGLSRYLNRRYGEGKKEQKKNHLPKNIRLRATFFINIRQSAGIHAMADMMEKGTKARWGNKIGYVLLPFTIALRDDPLDYVREAKAVIDRKKASLEPFYTYIFAKLVQKFFGIKAAGILNHKVFSNTTLWFSNVPGPQEAISFYGHQLEYFAPSCFGQPNALMIHVVSYIDKLTFIISADEGTIPDPHQLCDDLEESLKLIKDAVQASNRVKGD